MTIIKYRGYRLCLKSAKHTRRNFWSKSIIKFGKDTVNQYSFGFTFIGSLIFYNY